MQSHSGYSGCSGRSTIVVYGGGDIVFLVKRSNQWIQWMHSHSGHSGCSMQWTQYNSGIWWWRHCLWCKKCQTSGFSGCSMQYRVRSGIVVYGGGDIVFGAKMSNQRMQWMQYAVHSMQYAVE